MFDVTRPSTTYNGSHEPLELIPRIRTEGPEPGFAEALNTDTPAVLPCNACSARVMVRASISSAFTEDTAPVNELFFCTP